MEQQGRNLSSTLFGSGFFSPGVVKPPNSGCRLDEAGDPAMAKKADTESDKQGAKHEAFDALKGPKPRSIVIDGLVFVGGVGSLIWVLQNMAPT